jgi:hypothetical protein
VTLFSNLVAGDLSTETPAFSITKASTIPTMATTNTRTTSRSSPSFLGEEDEAALRIYGRGTDTLDNEEDNRRDLFQQDNVLHNTVLHALQLQLQPTPIGSHHPILVVSKFSVVDDSTLCDNDIICHNLIKVLLSSSDENDGSGQKSTSSRNTEDNCKAGSYSTAAPPLPSCNTAPPMHFTDTLEFTSAPITKYQEEEEEDITLKNDDFNKHKNKQAVSPRGGTIRDEKWNLHFQELLQFKSTVMGHCGVPNVYPPNPKLAQWVKRQRYQYKLRVEGKQRSSALTDERRKLLDDAGFIWDSHEATWMERWNELKSFCRAHGHCNVPTNYSATNRKLSVWVKRQRRQYKLYVQGAFSNMSAERLQKLEYLDFVFYPRGVK